MVVVNEFVLNFKGLYTAESSCDLMPCGVSMYDKETDIDPANRNLIVGRCAYRIGVVAGER